MLGLGNTLSGGIVPAAAAAGYSNTKSINFDGSDDYMIGPTNMTFDTGTYAFWFKTSVFEASIPIHFGTGNYFYFPTSGGNIVPFVVHPAGNFVRANIINDDAWHFMVVTVSGGSEESTDIIMYLDSVLLRSQNQTTTYTPTSDKMILGKSGTYTGYDYTGNIDEVSIWDEVVLDADAIAQLYNSGEPIDLASDSGDYDNSGDLTNWWRMGDGDSHPTIEDQAGSYDLTMTNMASGDLEDEVPSA